MIFRACCIYSLVQGVGKECVKKDEKIDNGAQSKQRKADEWHDRF